MDIALKFKRAIAAFSAGTLFASLLVFGPGKASAWDFQDVPKDHWAYEAVSNLADLGVFDKNPTFRWDAKMLRSEMVKSTVEAANLMPGFEQPAEPTFKDYGDNNAWYVPYFERAAAAGVITGDTDPQTGLPTGMARPAFEIVRAEAICIVDRAFDIEPTEMKEPPFPDMVKGSWYEDCARDLYSAGILVGDQGKLVPERPLIRAEFASLLWKAINYKDGPGPGPETPCDVDPESAECAAFCEENPAHPDCEEVVCPADDPDCVPPVEGDLEVSLNANTPKLEKAVPINATRVAVLSVDLTSEKSDITVSNITMGRSGPGFTEDIEAAYLYEGDVRVTTERFFSSENDNVKFSLKNFVIPAGKTRTLTLVIDISDTATAANEHTFFVESAESVVHNAETAVGQFPVTGNVMRIAGVTSSDVTINEGGSISKAKLGGKEETVGNFELTAGINDVALNSIGLTQGGSLDSEDMENCKLMRGADELATAEGFMGDLLTFKLETPYVIDNGQNRKFDVLCDITGGKAGETVILYLDLSPDLFAVDTELDYGANVINNLTQSDAQVVLIEGSAVVVLEDGPPSQDLPQNGTNLPLLHYSILTDRDVVAQNTRIQIDLQDTGGNGPDLSVLGSTQVNGAAFDTSSFIVDAVGGFSIGDTVQLTAASGTVNAVITNIVGLTISTDLDPGDAVADNSPVKEIDPYTLIKNVKIIDRDTEDTVVDPITNATTNSTKLVGPPDSYFRVHPQDYDFVAGEQRNFALLVDLDGNMPSGYQLRGQVFYHNPGDTLSFFKDLEANQQLPLEDVITSPVIGDFMFTAENSLVVTKANSPASNNFVKGDPAIPALGFTMTAGNAGDVRINDINVRVYGDATGNPFDGPAAYFPGDTAANQILQTMQLFEGNTLITPQAEAIKLVDLGAPGFTAGTDYYVAEFEDLNLIVESGASRTLTAKVKSFNTPGTHFIALDINPVEDIDAEDVLDENTVTASGAALNAAAVKNPLITIGAAGSLTLTSTNNPSADILVAGTNDQFVTNYTAKANDEAWKIETLTVINDNNDDNAADGTDGVKEVVIEYPTADPNDDPNAMTKKVTALTDAGVATFAGLDFMVPAGQERPLKVYANLKAIADEDTVSGSKFRLVVRPVNTNTSFRAVAQSSQTVDNFTVAGKVLNNSTANAFFSRQVVPVFTQNTTDNLLIDGTNELFDFNIAREGTATSVEVARLVFELTANDADNGNDLVLSNFRLKNPNLNLGDYNIFLGGTATDLKAGMIAGDQNNVDIVVTLNKAVGIQNLTAFQLEAVVAGTQDSDTISVRLSDDDENIEPVGMNALPNTNLNTGELVAALGTGIFPTEVAGFQQAQALNAGIVSADIVWTDRSDDNHVYSTTLNGSSGDFTNGLLLNVDDALDVVVQTAP